MRVLQRIMKKRKHLNRYLPIFLSLFIVSCSKFTFEESFKRAESEIGVGNYAEAADIYNRAVLENSKDPRVAVMWLRLGDLYANPMGELIDGLNAYQRAIESQPTSEASRLAHERRAEIFDRVGRPAGIVEEYAALLKFFEGHEEAPRYRMKLGEAYIMTKEFQQARTELRGFVEKSGVPTELRERALFNIGETYFLEGKPGKAVRFYYTAVKENPKSPLAGEAELRIATCLEEMGYLGTAHKFALDAKKRYPNPAIVDERIKGMENRGKGSQKNKDMKDPASGKAPSEVEEKPPLE